MLAALRQKASSYAEAAADTLGRIRKSVELKA